MWIAFIWDITEFPIKYNSERGFGTYKSQEQQENVLNEDFLRLYLKKMVLGGNKGALNNFLG